ncbi:HNH endonuclease [bacterium]|nr:HNH endonuclease [bacterium]
MPRDYKKEYKDFQSSPKAKKDRAARNKAAKTKNCPKGKEVHHKDGNPRNNSPSNCVCKSVKSNRGKTGEGGRTKGKKHNYPKNRKSPSTGSRKSSGTGRR